MELVNLSFYFNYQVMTKILIVKLHIFSQLEFGLKIFKTIDLLNIQKREEFHKQIKLEMNQ